jgi:hypothetical protein
METPKTPFLCPPIWSTELSSTSDRPGPTSRISSFKVRSHSFVFSSKSGIDRIGGYPCPNLYAPTPFATTPGHTPLPSPKMSHATFSGLQGMATVQPTFPNDRPTTPLQPLTLGLTAFPEVPTHKSRHTDPARLAQRAERKRLCAYALKPRFDYAFGSWAPEKLDWSFEGMSKSISVDVVLIN